MSGPAPDFPASPEESRYCVHGHAVWYGHECGECESEESYLWDDSKPRGTGCTDCCPTGSTGTRRNVTIELLDAEGVQAEIDGIEGEVGTEAFEAALDVLIEQAARFIRASAQDTEGPGNGGSVRFTVVNS